MKYSFLTIRHAIRFSLIGALALCLFLTDPNIHIAKDNGTDIANSLVLDLGPSLANAQTKKAKKKRKTLFELLFKRKKKKETVNKLCVINAAKIKG